MSSDSFAVFVVVALDEEVDVDVDVVVVLLAYFIFSPFIAFHTNPLGTLCQGEQKLAVGFQTAQAIWLPVLTLNLPKEDLLFAFS